MRAQDEVRLVFNAIIPPSVIQLAKLLFSVFPLTNPPKELAIKKTASAKLHWNSAATMYCICNLSREAHLDPDSTFLVFS